MIANKKIKHKYIIYNTINIDDSDSEVNTNNNDSDENILINASAKRKFESRYSELLEIWNDKKPWKSALKKEMEEVGTTYNSKKSKKANIKRLAAVLLSMSWIKKIFDCFLNNITFIQLCYTL